MSAPLRIVLTGCSGGGKSTLIAALADAGFRTVEEPGRNIVREALRTGEDVLPWSNPVGFARRAAEIALAACATLEGEDEPVFFDRSIIDAISHLERHGLRVPDIALEAEAACRFSDPVFFAPPWREIHVNDAERPIPFEEAVKEYEALLEAYGRRGFGSVHLQKSAVAARVRFVLGRLGLKPQ